jgi:hypothetical protein
MGDHRSTHHYWIVYRLSLLIQLHVDFILLHYPLTVHLLARGIMFRIEFQQFFYFRVYSYRYELRHEIVSTRNRIDTKSFRHEIVSIRIPIRVSIRIVSSNFGLGILFYDPIRESFFNSKFFRPLLASLRRVVHFLNVTFSTSLWW